MLLMPLLLFVLFVPFRVVGVFYGLALAAQLDLEGSFVEQFEPVNVPESVFDLFYKDSLVLGELGDIDAFEFLDFLLEVVEFGEGPVGEELHVVDLCDIEVVYLPDFHPGNCLALLLRAAVHGHDGLLDQFVVIEAPAPGLPAQGQVGRVSFNCVLHAAASKWLLGGC